MMTMINSVIKLTKSGSYSLNANFKFDQIMRRLGYKDPWKYEEELTGIPKPKMRLLDDGSVEFEMRRYEKTPAVQEWKKYRDRWIAAREQYVTNELYKHCGWEDAVRYARDKCEVGPPCGAHDGQCTLFCDRYPCSNFPEIVMPKVDVGEKYWES